MNWKQNTVMSDDTAVQKLDKFQDELQASGVISPQRAKAIADALKAYVDERLAEEKYRNTKW